jgi:hypothetical protein
MKFIMSLLLFLTLGSCGKLDHEDLDIQREEEYERKDFSEKGQKINR